MKRGREKGGKYYRKRKAGKENERGSKGKINAK
jgi:hypothetical protein